MSDKSHHIGGMYTLIAAIIGVIGTIGAVYVSKSVNEEKEKIEEKTAISSRITDEIESQIAHAISIKNSEPEIAFRLLFENRNSQDFTSEGQFYLGSFYEDGIGTERNYRNAIFWYKKSANNENVEAQYRLANLLFLTLTDRNNYPEAIKWYKRAANHGHIGS